MNASRVTDVITRLAPGSNPKYKPRDVTGDGHPETFCNVFVADVCAELRVPLPRLLANQQIAWLDSTRALAAGWHVEADPSVAGYDAEDGWLVLAGWSNPAGHGHIAVLRPSPSGLRIAQAGAKCFADGTLESGFGNLDVSFWSHELNDYLR